MGLAIALFHGFISMFLIGVTSYEDDRSVIQDAFWPAKVLVLVGAIIASLWMPRFILDYMFYPVVILALCFLIAQALLLVDVTYGITRAALDRGGCMMGMLMVVSGLMYGVIGFGTWAMFKTFEEKIHRAFVFGSAALTLILSICSVIPAVRARNETSGLFQASVLGTFNLAIICTAIIFSSETQLTYETSPYLSILTIITKVLAGLFIFVAITAAAYIGGSSGKEEGAGHEYNYSFFHAIFMVAAMYMVAVVTGWQQAVVKGTSLAFMDCGLAYWALVATAGVVDLIYAWTLFAPLVMSDRDFEF